MTEKIERGVLRKLFVGVLVLCAAFLVSTALTKKSTRQEYHWTRSAADHGVRPGKAQATELKEEEIVSILKKVQDPELGINVVDLGLLHKVSVVGTTVDIQIILTSPACPYNTAMIEDMKKALFNEPKVEEVKFIVALDLPWTPERMNPEAKRRLLESGPGSTSDKKRLILR